MSLTPPGYGLNVILIHLFQRLFFFLSPAHAANLLAGLLHALTLVLIYLTATRLLPPTKTVMNDIFVATGTLLVGWSAIFWLYSSVIEVFALGDLFAALVIYLTVRFTTKVPSNKINHITLIAFVWGLGIGHLQTLILLGPALLYALIATSPSTNLPTHIRHILIAVGATLLGFLISSALIIPLHARHQPYSWVYPPGISGWWHMVTRKDYSGTFLDQNTSITNPYLSSINIGDLLNKMPVYLVTIWNHLAGLPLILACIGIYASFKQLPKVNAWFLAIAYLTSGLLFGAYVTLNDYDPQNLKYRLLVGTAHRQYLMGMVLLAIFVGIGVNYVGKHILQSVSKQWRLATAIILITSWTAGVMWANFPMANQRPNSLVYNYFNTLLSHTAPNALILCSSDFACFNLYYQTIVEGKRPDVAVLGTSTLGRRNFIEQHHEYYQYFYPENPSFAAEMTAYNLPRRPVYFTEINQFIIDYLGLDGNPFYARPQHYSIQVFNTKPSPAVEPLLNPFLNQLFHTHIDNRDFHLMGFVDYIASYYQIAARYLTKYNQPQQAASALDLALYLNPNDDRVISWRQNLYALSHSFSQSLNSATPAAEYLKLAYQYQNSNELLQAETAARKAHYMEPNNPEPLKLLLSLYTKYNYPLFADWVKGHLDTLTSP